jgi:protein-arginine deiminase
MPGPGGSEKMIRIYIRSANYTGQLRVAGRVVYTHFRGKDKAGLTQYDPNHPNGNDSLNSFGNTETIPPYSGWPLGRIIRGSVPSFYPDQSFNAMLDAQGVQNMVTIDTSWLLVGHVDETLSYAKVNSPRGWVLVMNDAALAKSMLQQYQSQGYGSTPMFVGMTWSNGSSAQASINQVLADSNVMGASNEAVAEVNAQVAILKAQTGVTDAEIVKIPYLHWKTSGYSVAYQPGTANYSYVGPNTIAAPEPHGPIINGVDVMKQQMQNAFAPYGISIKWVEDWNLYHRLLGEVHCGSNTDRIASTKWWGSGK